MARVCTVCTRPDAGAINTALREGRSARSISQELGLSEDATQRHAANHVGTRNKEPKAAASSRNGAEPAGDPLSELVDALRAQALAGNPALVHQYRLALAAQATADHAAAPTRDLASEPEWIALRTALLEALEPFAEARTAVADALAAAGMD